MRRLPVGRPCAGLAAALVPIFADGVRATVKPAEPDRTASRCTGPDARALGLRPGLSSATSRLRAAGGHRTRLVCGPTQRPESSAGGLRARLRGMAVDPLENVSDHGEQEHGQQRREDDPPNDSHVKTSLRHGCIPVSARLRKTCAVPCPPLGGHAKRHARASPGMAPRDTAITGMHPALQSRSALPRWNNSCGRCPNGDNTPLLTAAQSA
jgi:hypothetical protein